MICEQCKCHVDFVQEVYWSGFEVIPDGPRAVCEPCLDEVLEESVKRQEALYKEPALKGPNKGR